MVPSEARAGIKPGGRVLRHGTSVTFSPVLAWDGRVKRTESQTDALIVPDAHLAPAEPRPAAGRLSPITASSVNRARPAFTRIRAANRLPARRAFALKSTGTGSRHHLVSTRRQGRGEAAAGTRPACKHSCNERQRAAVAAGPIARPPSSPPPCWWCRAPPLLIGGPRS